MSRYAEQTTATTSADDETDRTFPDGAVVQLISDPVGDGSRVVSVATATIVVTDRAITARTRDGAWSWMLDEIVEVQHGLDGPWSILVVPGVADHGVAVARGQVAEFRACLRDRVPEKTVADPTALHRSPSPRAPRTPPEPEPPQRSHVTSADGGSEAPVNGVPPVAEPRSTPGPPPGSAERPDDGAAPLSATSPAAPLEAGQRPPVTQPVPAVAANGLAGLESRQVSAWFGSHHVLDRVSLTMQPGQVTALIGPSGCGKSTYLRILNRMHEMIPSAALSGEVLLDGTDIYDPSRKLTDARRQIGMVFQKPNPFPAMSIYDNVVASFRLTGTKISASEKDDVVESCLTKAGLWAEVRDRLRQPGGGLSGGQQQRLCIARALAIRPRVLLMDEPCSALDPTSTRRIEETIVELRSEVTIVIVTHNMQQAARVSNRCAFFLAEAGTPGVVVEHGETDAMFESPQDERTLAYVTGRFG